VLHIISTYIKWINLNELPLGIYFPRKTFKFETKKVFFAIILKGQTFFLFAKKKKKKKSWNLRRILKMNKVRRLRSQTQLKFSKISWITKTYPQKEFVPKFMLKQKNYRFLAITLMKIMIISLKWSNYCQKTRKKTLDKFHN